MGWWLTVRLNGLWHILRRHDVEWKAGNAEDRVVCAGDIICHTCNTTLWCRWYDPKWLGGRKEFPEE